MAYQDLGFIAVHSPVHSPVASASRPTQSKGAATAPAAASPGKVAPPAWMLRPAAAVSVSVPGFGRRTAVPPPAAEQEVTAPAAPKPMNKVLLYGGLAAAGLLVVLMMKKRKKS